MKDHTQFWIFLLTALFSFSITQCAKENLTEVKIKTTEEIPLEFRAAEIDFGEVDGFIIMDSRAYYGPCGRRAAFNINAKFGEGHDVGTIIVEGKEVPSFVDGSGVARYQYMGAGSDLDQAVASGAISCNFASNVINEYASFSREGLLFPKGLCAQSSLGDSRSFPKDRDLTITWEPDPNIDNIYISICAAGTPCIFKEAPDTGSYTVSSGEFAGFIPGAYVLFYIGRGYAEVMAQTDGKKIALVTASLASFPDIFVE